LHSSMAQSEAGGGEKRKGQLRNSRSQREQNEENKGEDMGPSLTITVVADKDGDKAYCLSGEECRKEKALHSKGRRPKRERISVLGWGRKGGKGKKKKGERERGKVVYWTEQ